MVTLRHLHIVRLAAEMPAPNRSDMHGRSPGRLTERQVQVLRSIEFSIATRGVPPSLQELCRMICAASKASVVEHLIALEKKGFIRRDAGVRRGLCVLVSSEHAVVMTPKPIAKTHFCLRCRKAMVG